MRKARQLKLSGFSHDEYFFAFFIYLSATKHAHILRITNYLFCSYEECFQVLQSDKHNRSQHSHTTSSKSPYHQYYPKID